MEPKAHYHVNKSPTPDPILRQMNPVHNFPPYFPKISSNIILHLRLDEEYKLCNKYVKAGCYLKS